MEWKETNEKTLNYIFPNKKADDWVVQRDKASVTIKENKITCIELQVTNKAKILYARDVWFLEQLMKKLRDAGFKTVFDDYGKGEQE